MNRALLLVDIQNDFLPGGSLAVAQGDEVIAVANRLMANYPLVVATQDWHPADHGSFATQYAGKEVGEFVELDGLTQILWPEHCVMGSDGAEFAGQLQTSRIDVCVQKGTDRNVDSYSGFFDNARRRQTELEQVLRHRNVTDVDVIGLATDYCVKFTALDAADLGFRTRVIQDGVRGVELADGDIEQALAEMADAGIEIV